MDFYAQQINIPPSGQNKPGGGNLSNKRIEVLLKTIKLLKAELDQLVKESTELTDQEVVKKSQELDRLLTEYYKLLKKTMEGENT